MRNIMKFLMIVTLILIIPINSMAKTLDGNFAAVDTSNITTPDKLTYLDQRNGWISNGQNLLENFYSCTSPETVYVPEWDYEGGYPYRMFFYGWAYTEGNKPTNRYEGYPGGDAIFCARAESIYGPWQVWSKDPQTKEGYWDDTMSPYFWCPVFTCSTDPNDWYDNHHIADATVVWANGQFHMMTSSQGSDVDGKFGDFDTADTDGYSGCAIGAISTDGINWIKAEGPLLIWENEKGFNENAVGGWYAGNGYYGALGQPSLLYEDGVWKCWFTYNASVMSARWGYAENHGDFINPDDWQFINYYDNPLNIVGSTDFDVIKIGDIYYGFANTWINYFGLTYDYLANYPLSDWQSMGSTCLTQFMSYDGIEWTPIGYFYPDDDTPANNCSQVMYDPKTNNICLFYAVMRGMSDVPWFDWRWYAIRVRTRSLDMFTQDYTYYDKPSPKPAESWIQQSDRQNKETGGNGKIDAFGRILPFEDERVKIHKATGFDQWYGKNDIILNGKATTNEITLLGQAFPESAEITNGKVIITSAKGANGKGISRFSLCINDPMVGSAQMQAKICDGIGIYVENNTDTDFILNSFNKSSSSFILSNDEGIGYFIDLNGNCTTHALASSANANNLKGITVPAGAKGYAIIFIDDLSLSGTHPYNASTAPILNPGVKINNLKVDKSKNESVVFDDFFFFGINNKSNISNIKLKNALHNNTPNSSAEPTASPNHTQLPTAEPTETLPQDTSSPESSSALGSFTNTVIKIVCIAVIVVTVIVTTVILIKMRKNKQ